MNIHAPSKRDWTLTSEAFDQLLLAFDVDREKAGEMYETIRSKLIEFFEARGSDVPLEHTDDAINRVARRITEGERIQYINSYFYGVARLVWLENLRQRDRHSTLELGPTPIAADNEELEVERQYRESRLHCLERCLARLSATNRTLIVEYYREEKGIKIEHRKQQAARLNTTVNGLRLRASRIRAELSQCVHSCLEQGSTRNRSFDTEY